jgi:hypothetical protein
MLRILTTGGILCALAMGAPSAAHSGDRAETKVRFKSASYSDQLDVTTYRGTIASSRRACLQGRKVTVYRDSGDQDPDEKIGSDLAQKNSQGDWVWAVSEQGASLAGNYYARAKATDACEGDKSNVFLFA